MTSLARKIKRRQSGGKTPGDKVSRENAFHARVATENRVMTHVTYLHPTKGYRHRNKNGVALAQASKRDILDKVIWPMVQRCQQAHKRAKLMAKIGEAQQRVAKAADKALRTFTKKPVSSYE